jgi:hypothetical protein
MLKRICFFAIFATTSLFSMAPSASSATQDQLNQLQAQLKVIKKAWNVARIHIKQAKKLSPQLYAKIQPTLEKVIANPAFVSKMEADVANQFNAIVSFNGSFTATEYRLADFAKAPVLPYGQELFKAMAAKAAYTLLAKKLSQKVQELTLAIKTMQQTQDIAYAQ